MVDTGSVYSVQFSQSTVQTPQPDGMEDVSPYIIPAIADLETPSLYYTIPEPCISSCEFIPITVARDRHFDVWLSADGKANICENKWSQRFATVLDIECGDRPDAICWEWDICGNDDPHKSSDEQEADDAFLDWFGGWGNMGSTMAAPSYEDDLDVLDDLPESRLFEFLEDLFAPPPP